MAERLHHLVPNIERKEIEIYDEVGLWHCRFGYLNVKSVQALRGMVSDIDLPQSNILPSSFVCEGCIESKQ